MTREWRKIRKIGLPAALALALFAFPVEAKQIKPGGAAEGKTAPEQQERGKTLGVVDPADAELAERLLERFKIENTIKEQRNKFLAEHHTRAGIALFNKLDYDSAKVELENALKYDPSNMEAREHLRKARAILGLRDARHAGILDKVERFRLIERELARHEMKMALERAKELMKDGNYDQAVERFESVRELVRWIAPYFDDDLEPYKSQAEQHIRTAERLRKAREEDNRAAARGQAAEAARMRSKQQHERHLARMGMLVTKGRDLLAEARYAEAQSLAERILELDPMSRQAQAMRDLAFREGLAADTRMAKKAEEEQALLSWASVKKSQIPYNTMVRYPDHWARICKRAIMPIGAEEDAEEPPWRTKLKATLEREVSFDFVETPLRDVLGFLQQITNANIILDEKAIDLVGDPQLTLKVTDMKLARALDWIAGMADLKYALKDEAIFISDEQGVSGGSSLRLYDVTDLLLQVKDFPGDLRLLRDRSGNAPGGIGTDPMGDGAWPDGFGEDRDDRTFTPDDLVELVRNAIAPDSTVEMINGRVMLVK